MAAPAGRVASAQALLPHPWLGLDCGQMVRAAELNDAASIARVHVQTWKTTYRGLLPDEFLASLDEAHYADRWKRGIADASSRVYVVEDESGVVGFASGGRERAGEDGYGGELYAIYVLERAQRHGRGRELVRAVVGGLREMGFEDMIIWVLRDNLAARRFYERLGGVYVRSQPITFGPAVLQEVSYGWRRLDDVAY
jgi:ribosomal protein S18 acetylase RimI-like enzyme